MAVQAPMLKKPRATKKTKPNYALRQAREQFGWFKTELADKIGVTPITVSRWEQGKTQPRGYNRRALCAALGKTAAELGLLTPSPNQEAMTPVPPLRLGENVDLSVLQKGEVLEPATLHSIALMLLSSLSQPQQKLPAPKPKVSWYRRFINFFLRSA